MRPVKRLFLLVVIVAVLSLSRARAETIPGLYNTGFNASGSLLSAGQIDAHYTLSSGSLARGGLHNFRHLSRRVDC